MRNTLDSYKTYLRWSSAEWRYEGFGDQHLAAPGGDLVSAALNLDTDVAGHVDTLIRTMIDALAHLRTARADRLRSVTLFVTITDSDEAVAEENRSATQLNAPDLAQAFLARFG